MAVSSGVSLGVRSFGSTLAVCLLAYFLFSTAMQVVVHFTEEEEME